MDTLLHNIGVIANIAADYTKELASDLGLPLKEDSNDAVTEMLLNTVTDSVEALLRAHFSDMGMTYDPATVRIDDLTALIVVIALHGEKGMRK